MKTCYYCFNQFPDGAKFCPHCGSGSDLRNEVLFPQALPCGAVLNGKYIVGCVLGQGGFGITYVGQQYDTGKLVAIKEFFPNTLVSRDVSKSVVPFNTYRLEDFDYGKKQFLDEAKTLVTFIGSPNIVRVYSYFEENATAYFVMEYVRGKSLRQYIKSRGGRISWDETWELLMPVLDALSEVHSKKIVHRDIKPDNIIITEEGRAKLIDFGAARYKQSERSQSLTAVLTPGYAPPEQYYTRGDQGSWTDVYALAATMYFSITGKAPPESIERAFNDRLEKPSSLGVPIPEYGETALLKALAVKEKDRFETTYDFRNAVLEGKRLEEENRRLNTPSPRQMDLTFRERQKTAVSGYSAVQEKPNARMKPEQMPSKNNAGAARTKTEQMPSKHMPESNAKAGKDDSNAGRGKGTGKESQGKKRNQQPANPASRNNGNADLPRKIGLAAAIIAVLAVVVFAILKTSGPRPAGNKNDGNKEMSAYSEEQQINESSEDSMEPAVTRDPMELTDTWEEIIAAGKDGTYKERYRIGDTKELDMGAEGIITMKLVAMDEDDLADGSGKAPMTWIADETLQTRRYMNGSPNEGGWEKSEMRSWLRDKILPLMPEEVRENICEVTKYSSYLDGGESAASKDMIWIPSAKEVFFADQSDWVNEHCEKEGASYTEAFPDDNSRKRVQGSAYTPAGWCLRSAHSSDSNGFYLVSSRGTVGYNTLSEPNVVFGFCLGR